MFNMTYESAPSMAISSNMVVRGCGATFFSSVRYVHSRRAEKVGHNGPPRKNGLLGLMNPLTLANVSQAGHEQNAHSTCAHTPVQLSLNHRENQGNPLDKSTQNFMSNWGKSHGIWPKISWTTCFAGWISDGPPQLAVLKVLPRPEIRKSRNFPCVIFIWLTGSDQVWVLGIFSNSCLWRCRYLEDEKNSKKIKCKVF